jgi:hypothetical protein
MTTMKVLRALVAVTVMLLRGAKAATPATKIVGNSGVSAQLMFLQSNGQVAILDKSENNPVTAPGSTAPAFAVFYNYNANTFQTTNLSANTFCAGGGVLGDGRWIVTGGNPAVGAGNWDGPESVAPYYDTNGGHALRFLPPCSGSNCQWIDSTANQMEKERWYPWVEPMSDGSVLMIGGMHNGGFVPSQGTNEPTAEFYPPNGAATTIPVLQTGLPVNLYPVSYLMGDGRVFISANQQAVLWNTASSTQTSLNNIPVTPRNYPAGGGSVMLPMVPSNNWQQTIMFCGGTNLGSDAAWGTEGGPAVPVTEVPATNSCAQISPLVSPVWTQNDPLTIPRTMGQFVNLPDGTIWFGMGVGTGVAGYSYPGSTGQPVGNSLGDHPVLTTMIYNPTAKVGKRWSSSTNLKVPRLYHSTATLLPDSSILIAGSNPNADVTTDSTYNTEYRVERWYPSYYNQARPSNSGLPSSLGYGGAGFTLTMKSKTDAKNTKVVIIRTGFVTHGWAMGQRMLQLATVVSGTKVKVAAMPANSALFAPGVALAFVVVNGVPSTGKFVMIGNGQIGPQTLGANTILSKRQVPTGFSQPPSLSNAQIQQANSLANALNGAPVQGISLSSSAASMHNGVNQTIQAQVASNIQKQINGTLPNRIFG